MMGPNSDIEDGSIMTKNPPRYPETSENLIVGTLDSVGQKERPGTGKERYNGWRPPIVMLKRKLSLILTSQSAFPEINNCAP